MTLAALGDIEKKNWAKEDGDGTRRPIFRMFISDETEVEEEEEDDEDDEIDWVPFLVLHLFQIGISPSCLQLYT